jgi:hypothetical protein
VRRRAWPVLVSVPIITPMSSEAKNLEAISKAIDTHNAECEFPATEVRMNPFEVERLGWEEIRGLPVVGDPQIATGRFRIVCGGDEQDDELEEVEAVGEPMEVAVPERGGGFPV